MPNRCPSNPLRRKRPASSEVGGRERTSLLRLSPVTRHLSPFISGGLPQGRLKMQDAVCQRPAIWMGGRCSCGRVRSSARQGRARWTIQQPGEKLILAARLEKRPALCRPNPTCSPPSDVPSAGFVEPGPVLCGFAWPAKPHFNESRSYGSESFVRIAESWPARQPPRAAPQCATCDGTRSARQETTDSSGQRGQRRGKPSTAPRAKKVVRWGCRRAGPLRDWATTDRL